MTSGVSAGSGNAASGDVCEVVVTGPSREWIAEFTGRLVEDRLVACGHITDSIRSIYRWEGNVQDEAEARVALHTRRALVPAIVERAGRDHPYDVPCVIALPIVDGNPGYVAWILEVTLEQGPGEVRRGTSDPVPG